ncbi:unnamed protein product [Sympodiomycopsis kandeliae]
MRWSFKQARQLGQISQHRNRLQYAMQEFIDGLNGNGPRKRDPRVRDRRGRGRGRGHGGNHGINSIHSTSSGGNGDTSHNTSGGGGNGIDSIHSTSSGGNGPLGGPSGTDDHDVDPAHSKMPQGHSSRCFTAEDSGQCC